MTTLDTLANAAAEMAMRGFAEYAQTYMIEIDDYEAATEVLRTHVKQSLPKALEDVRQAYESNMHQIGVSTFALSMRLAGFDAAKEFTQEN